MTKLLCIEVGLISSQFTQCLSAAAVCETFSYCLSCIVFLTHIFWILSGNSSCCIDELVLLLLILCIIFW